jgi:uncharacterized caspase-like protein
MLVPLHVLGDLPVSRIFISHSSVNNAEAIALRDWMVAEGWSDLFLDLDPDRGIAAGERWERALNEAARRCEAVLFLISKAWLASRWCMNELTLARRLNKRLFGVLVEEGLAIADLPVDVTSHWQLVNLATGRDHQQFRVTLPVTGEEQHVTYSREGLTRLKAGLQRAGLHASYFAWPPETDPKRAPYRGLRPLEADDAGIFFGREAPVIEAIDRMRGLREATPPRLMVILGASGAGKSSFLRAGLLPRLGRDPRTFLPLPVIRPERAAISGETGLVSALASAFEATSLRVARGDIREAVAGGAPTLKPLLARFQAAAEPPPVDGGPAPRPPTLVISIDQGEELFLAEAQAEAQPFMALLRDLVSTDAPPVIAVFTIRSDNYERLQQAPELADIHKLPLDLGAMPKGSYAEVVKGPIRRLDGTARTIRMDDALVDALLADLEAGGAKDALPLLAFTLERLYGEFGATGHLRLDHYAKLGGVKGSIEAAVERAFKAADTDTRMPRDREARLTLLRRGLIPWLAGIDPDTKAPRRRVARLSEIPPEARPLIDLLVEQRLLATDVAKDTGETTIEPAHEALLRQWGLLQGWLSDDTGLLTVLDGIKRAARDWAANAKASSWLAHSADRLRAAERLLARSDLAANLEPTDKAYVVAAQQQERAERRRARSRLLTGLAASVALGLLGAAGGWQYKLALEEDAFRAKAMRTDVSGQMVAYATQFGNIALDGEGRNSPYTIGLLSQLSEKRTSLIAAVLAANAKIAQDTHGRQKPFLSTDLNAELFLHEQPAGRRLTAIVIGVSEYPNLKLANPGNDAADWSAFLKKTGFDVKTYLNPNIIEMRRLLRDSAEMLRAPDPKKPNTLTVFFFAGFGVHVDGETYLIPANSNLTSIDDLDFEAIRLRRIQEYLSQVSDASVIFLDTTLDNPFAGQMRRRASGERD